MSRRPTTYEYEAFGATVASSVRLPALPRVDASDESTTGVQSTANAATTDEGSTTDARLTVRESSLPPVPSGLPEPSTLVCERPNTFEVYRSSAGLDWHFPSIGRLRVQDGSTIEIDLAASTDEATRQRVVAGPGVYSALAQRDRPVLHASAVVVDGVAVAFAGASGHGKSTAAAACYAAGHDVLADDVVAVDPTEPPAAASSSDDARPVVAPAYPQLRLDCDGVTALSLESKATERRGGECAVDVSDRFRTDLAPLAAVYVLDDGDGPARSEQLPAHRSLFELLRTSYLLAPENEDAATLTGHQQRCADLVGATDVRRLVRPRSLDRLDELVDVVEEDVAADDSSKTM